MGKSTASAPAFPCCGWGGEPGGWELPGGSTFPALASPVFWVSMYVLTAPLVLAARCWLVIVCQAIEAAKVDKTDKPFSEMKIISIDIS